MEATDSAILEVEGRDDPCEGAEETMNVRCRDSRERPTVEVSGLGQGMRAVTLPTEPSCNCMGKPAMSVLIACD